MNLVSGAKIKRLAFVHLYQVKTNDSEDIEEYRPYDHFSTFESEKFLPSQKSGNSSDPNGISSLVMKELGGGGGAPQLTGPKRRIQGGNSIG